MYTGSSIVSQQSAFEQAKCVVRPLSTVVVFEGDGWCVSSTERLPFRGR